jgi:sec-independent protein translocase protein TatB
MFDIGFLELVICGVIALLVLGPERLPGAARTAGHWVGKARRMIRHYTSELDSQLKAEELREELRKAGDIGLDDVRKNVQGAMDEARNYGHMILSDEVEPPLNPPDKKPLETPDAKTEADSSDNQIQPPTNGESGKDADPEPQTTVNRTPESRS